MRQTKNEKPKDALRMIFFGIFAFRSNYTWITILINYF